MRIGIIGINHKSADLRLREKLAKVCQHRFGLKLSIYSPYYYVLLSTCNRTEIYFSSTDLTTTHSSILSILRHEVKEEFEHRIYSYFGPDCFFHLARVTAGVDSAIVGETEIQGQVKRAYEGALHFRSLSKELHFLFQKCLKIGKEIRAQDSVHFNFPTMEESILQVAKNVLGNLEQREILFVGLSEINKKLLVEFKQKGINHIAICNRHDEKALKIAKEKNIDFLPWNQLTEWEYFDLTIFGTRSPDFLVSNSFLETKRLIIDLSVPRNVHPKIGRQKNTVLLNVDQIINRKQRLKGAMLARLKTQVIASSVEKQIAIFKLKELCRPHSTLAV